MSEKAGRRAGEQIAKKILKMTAIQAEKAAKPRKKSIFKRLTKHPASNIIVERIQEVRMG